MAIIGICTNLILVFKNEYSYENKATKKSLAK